MTEANYFSSQLKVHRARLSLSMQVLADLASISKSMVCKIERGETQPTIDVAARIASALGMPLTDLIQPPEKAMAIVIPSEQQPKESHGNINCRTLSPTRHGHAIRWNLVTIAPSTSFQNPPDNILNKNYYLYLRSGELSIQVDQERFDLKAEDSFYFRPRTSFLIENLSQTEHADYALIQQLVDNS
ncbi:XRE family transcriptional regulator [Vibrio sp. S4M6]|uniref:helix-turn-helix domain-containing protein n=1 Tax=Vibrio sinus TaxID=2946865 RepID=UPI002029F99D|nr:XRE family transcriptional regulator [Vibrio sinus]MCL9782404.1 XRE family transcriptional regulator [Vibrio sinus]